MEFLFLTKPHIEIKFWWNSTDNKTTNFVNIFTNTGYSPATHVRLTISYPGAKIIRSNLEYNNENATLEQQNQNSSLVEFIPRLTPGASVRVNTTINTIIENLSKFSQTNDFSFNTVDVAPIQPYSVSATYDQGSDAYTLLSLYDLRYSPFNPQILVIPIMSVFVYLCFAMIYRHKRKNRAKLMIKILTDAIVTQILNREPEKILPTQSRDVNMYANRHIFNNYEDYKRIRNLYRKLKDRKNYILNNQRPDTQKLKDYNQEAIDYANDVCKNIKWVDYYKFDWIIASPLIILGSFFITFVCEGLPFFIIWNIFGVISIGKNSYIIFVTSSSIIRGFVGLITIKKIVKASNGIGIGKTTLPFSLLIMYIMGISSFFIFDILLSEVSWITNYINNFVYLSYLIYGFDIWRMYLLTRTMSQRYKKALKNYYRLLNLDDAIMIKNLYLQNFKQKLSVCHTKLREYLLFSKAILIISKVHKN